MSHINLNEWNIDTVPLNSEKGVNYTKLKDLLKARRWQEADQETLEQMLSAINIAEQSDLEPEHLLYFPTTDIKTIDQLWIQGSQGRYGFSIQKKIYLNCGGTFEGKRLCHKTWEKFVDQVGWRVNGMWCYYQDLDENSINIMGHLPKLVGLVYYGKRWFFFLLSHQDL